MVTTESALSTANRVVFAGRMFFAIGLIGIGVQHFIFADFIPVMVPWWPSHEHVIWAYIVGAILITGGLLIIFQKNPRTILTLLGILFLLSVVLLHIPSNIRNNLLSPGAWTNAFKELVFFGSAFVIAGSLPKAKSNVESSFMNLLTDKIVPFGKFPLGLTVIVFGVDHFLYPGFVATLVPSWIPGPMFWTYFAGIALIAAGVGIVFNIKARLAATLLGVMIFIWLIVLHIPRAIADPSGGLGNEWTSVFEALAFSGIAFILGQTLPKKLPHPSPLLKREGVNS